jgi:hypothetical protein
MTGEPRVGLLDVDPDLGRFLSEDDRAHAARITLTAHDVRGEFQVDELLARANAFGALLFEGIVLQRIRIAEQPTLRLLGPGDLLTAGDIRRSRMIVDTDCTADADTRVVMLDDRVLLAAQRWPRLFTGLHAKSAEQAERIILQAAICQLPRVTDRVLALMWMLAESWGHVTSSGVTLPLALRHDELGGMIGARRPTVTLALGELSERGAIVRQDRGWLLVEELPAALGARQEVTTPVLIRQEPTVWSKAEEPEATRSARTHAELLASIARLRDEHLVNRERIFERLAQLRRARELSAGRRALRAGRRVSPGPAPSP